MTKTVLIVDDDPVDAYAVRRIVKRLQLAVELEHVEDGEEALAWFRRPGPRPCCVLLDLNMPRMNGSQFLRALRSNPGLEKIPVYVVTTSTRAEDRRACEQSGIDGYVVKTTEVERFDASITEVLRAAIG